MEKGIRAGAGPGGAGHGPRKGFRAGPRKPRAGLMELGAPGLGY